MREALPAIVFIRHYGYKQADLSCVPMYKGTSTPALSFEYDVQQEMTTLYEDVFDMTALRYDISMPIPDGFGDQAVTWTLNYRGQTSRDTFYIPKWDQKWRGGL